MEIIVSDHLIVGIVVTNHLRVGIIVSNHLIVAIIVSNHLIVGIIIIVDETIDSIYLRRYILSMMRPSIGQDNLG